MYTTNVCMWYTLKYRKIIPLRFSNSWQYSGILLAMLTDEPWALGYSMYSGLDFITAETQKWDCIRKYCDSDGALHDVILLLWLLFWLMTGSQKLKKGPSMSNRPLLALCLLDQWVSTFHSYMCSPGDSKRGAWTLGELLLFHLFLHGAV